MATAIDGETQGLRQVREQAGADTVGDPRLGRKQPVAARDQERGAYRGPWPRRPAKIDSSAAQIERECRMREMTLEGLGDPALSLAQVAPQYLRAVGAGVTL